MPEPRPEPTEQELQLAELLKDPDFSKLRQFAANEVKRVWHVGDEDAHAGTATGAAKSAARSPIMIAGALVLPEITVGITEASATRRPSTP